MVPSLALARGRRPTNGLHEAALLQTRLVVHHGAEKPKSSGGGAIPFRPSRPEHPHLPKSEISTHLESVAGGRAGGTAVH